MAKKCFLIFIIAVLLLTGCKSSNPVSSSPAETTPTRDTEVTTQPIETEQETPEETQVSDSVPLPILDEINCNVEIGTAGAFMSAVQAAADLLEWGVNTGLDPEEIRTAAVQWIDNMDDDAKGLFSLKLEQVDEAYNRLLEEGAEDLLSSAGLEDSGYPWSREPVEPIEAIMEAAGLR